MELHQVEGHKHLRKDPHTGVVLNVDPSGYEAAKAAKAERDKTADRLSKLESQLEQILKHIS